MKLITPDYYNNFSCIAGRCRHNCCIGWEIDIDEDTLELYENIPGEFGERLRCGITRGDTPCFKLGDGERCVFLNERGLCDIILSLGEDALCDICTDHPRFRNFFANRTEMGLGLCCEEACRIILGQRSSVKLVASEDDGKDVPDPDDVAFFEERQRVFDILQDRSVSLSDRFAKLSREYGIPEDTNDPANWAEFYRGLERLDPEWDKCLDMLAEYDGCAESDDTLWENLAVYLIFRYSGDYPLADILAFCIHTVRMLRTVCDAASADFDGICEICRMWSSEIEYSDENIARILDRLNI